MSLPEGIALFQVTLPDQRLCFIASTLEPTHARMAREAAAVLAARGQAVIVFTTAALEFALELARSA